MVLAIVVIGTVAAVSLGASTLADAQRQSEIERAQLSLTQFDARAAQVSLGDSNVQSIPLASSGHGRYDVVGDAGWIRVVHHNYHWNGANETIVNDTLGALVYRNGETTVAYEGGGVWRSDGGNASVMISPPEFHYRDETLVIPIISVSGDDSASGTRRAVVTSRTPTARVFPAKSGTGTSGIGAPYDDGDPYQNPVTGGYVTITIKSEYYEAWGRFLASRTRGPVTLDHAAKTATIRLIAPPMYFGPFQMPEEGHYIDIRGIDNGHVLEQFTIDLAPDNLDAANFNNLEWAMYVQNGNQEFELYFRLRGPDDNKSTLCHEQVIAATIYYSDSSGNPYQGWYAPSAFRTTCTDRDGDGKRDEVHLVANLTSDLEFTMRDLSSADLQHFNPQGATRSTKVTFDEHKATVAWEPKTFTDSGTNNASVDDLLNHYFALLGPDFDLRIEDQSSDSVNEGQSNGVLNYDTHGRVTFLHVTSNEVRIVLE